MSLLESLGIPLPIVPAPMAGVSTPKLAAAVSNAGALGSISVAATDAIGAREMIAGVRVLSSRPFNVNVFVHQPTAQDAIREIAWFAAMAPLFRKYGMQPPAALRAIYKSFAKDDEMLALLVETVPAVVSFHFDLPDARRMLRSRTRDARCWPLLPESRRRQASMRSLPRAGKPVGIAKCSILKLPMLALEHWH
jgi:nitronate monooxygenase